MTVSNDADVLLVGTYPPPYGGASVFVKRLEEKLEQHGISCLIFDAERGACRRGGEVLNESLARFLLSPRRRFKLYHIHASSAKLKLMFTIKARLEGASAVISLHSFDFELRGLKRAAYMAAVRLANEVWVNNQQNAKTVARELKIKIEKIKVVTHFLVPTEIELCHSEDNSLDAFAKRHTPLLVTSAWKLVTHNGKDLYGGDTCIRLLAALKHEFPAAGLVFFIGRTGNDESLKKMRENVTAQSLNEDVLLMVGDHELVPHLRNADLFLRCTLSDSFGASVAESLFVGTPVIASDVCPRPSGTTTYDVNNFEELLEKSRAILESRNRMSQVRPDLADSLAVVLSRYNQLLLKRGVR